MFPRVTQSIRPFSTTNFLQRAILNQNYSANEIWKTRHNCKLLANVNADEFFQNILTKISTNAKITALDLDIFVNVAQPEVHFEEAVHLLGKFRRSISAHTVLESTPHATCRLFLAGKKPYALLKIIEDRVNYGVFPDLYMMNILIDSALESEDYALASRLAAHCMLQEEFGENQLTDRLCLYAVIKYLESKTNFEDWKNIDSNQDLGIILGSIAKQSENEQSQTLSDEKSKDNVNEEEEEDDAEYIRIPFLRNEYNDNHFDLKNPRKICGKTLNSLAISMTKNYSNLLLTSKSKLLGSILFGSWADAKVTLNGIKASNEKLDETTAQICKHYIENLNDLETEIPEDVKSYLISAIDSLTSQDLLLLSLEVEELIKQDQNNLEEVDTECFATKISEWSDKRNKTLEKQMENILRAKKLQEINNKMKDLERREKYLYYIDRLRKEKVTKIQYN